MIYLQRFLRHNRSTLLKTGSYYLMHISVAAGVAYAVTGDVWAALTLSLLEPSVQAIAYFWHDRAWARMPAGRLRLWLKTASYYLLHIAIASAVAYMVTGSLLTALTLSLLEPTVQMAFYFFHEKWWQRHLSAAELPPALA